MEEKSALEKKFKTIFAWFTEERKIIFFVTLIVGLVVHFELYSKELLAYDAYWHYGSFLAKGWEVSLGRFLIPVTDLLRGTVVVSFLTTIISLITMAFTAVILNELLGIKKRYLQILVGILIVVTPTLSLTLMYAYTATGYTLAMFFAVLSVYFLNKEKNIKNIILSIACIVITLALYQAYLCVITTLWAIKCIFELLNKKELKKFLKNAVIDIGIIILGMIVYYISFNIVVKILHLTIADYSGANSLISIETLKNIFASIKSTYITFFNFFFGDEILNNSGWYRGVWYALTFLCIVANFVSLIISKKVYKNPSKIILLVCILVLFPILTCSIKIITWTRDINLLMSSSLYLTLLILLKQMEEIWQVDKMNKHFIRVNNIAEICSFVFVSVILWTFVLSDNATYVATDMYNKQMTAIGNRVLAQIEENEEATEDMPILILGKLKFDIYNSSLLKLTNFDVSDINMWTWQIFLQDNLGLGRKICTMEENNSMYENEEYINMPIFPNEGSIKVINNSLVVKLAY